MTPTATSPHTLHPHRPIGRQLIPYATPWVLLVTLGVTAVIIHGAWGVDPAAAPWAVLGLSSTTASLTVLAYHAARARANITQWHATLTVATAGSWLTVALITGPTQRPLLDLLILGGGSVALSWNLRKSLRGDGTDTSSGGWENLAEKVKLAGSRLQQTKIDGPAVKSKLMLDRGRQTMTDAQAAIPHLASAYGVPPNSVRITPNLDHADQADLTIVPRNPLKTSINWPGPTHAGSSVAAPLHIGTYDDGASAHLWLPGDDAAARNATHLLVMGMTGSGKSEGALVLVAELLTRRDVVVWAADAVKGSQTLGAISAGLDWAATTRPHATAMLQALRSIVPARTDWLGQRGLKQWHQGCGIPLLVVLLEEAPEIISESATFVRLAQQSRSAGVILIVSMQRATFTNIPTDARAQLGAALCFGVRDDTDATFALGRGVIDAGASPAIWGNRIPGLAYLEAPGIPEERWPIPLRVFKTTSHQIETVVGEHSHIRATLDPVSCAAAGDTYTQRHNTTPDNPITLKTGKANDTAIGLAENIDKPPIPPQPEPELTINIDPSQPLEPPEIDLQFANPSTSTQGQQVTHEQATQALRQYLIQLRSDGAQSVSPAQLATLRTRIGRSRTWISRQLTQLVDDGLLEPTGQAGTYSFPATDRVGAA